MSQIAPAISLCSNARDMAKWMAFLLRQGRDLQGNELIKKDTLKQSWMGNIRVRDAMYKSAMKKPQTEETLDYTQYAMAWFVGAYRGLYFVTGAGVTSGYRGIIVNSPCPETRDLKSQSFY